MERPSQSREAQSNSLSLRRLANPHIVFAAADRDKDTEEEEEGVKPAELLSLLYSPVNVFKYFRLYSFNVFGIGQKINNLL